MSPEDDLQTQRIQAIDNISLSSDWKPILQNNDVVIKSTGPAIAATTSSTPVSYTNGKNNGVTKYLDNQIWQTTNTKPITRNSDLLYNKHHHLHHHNHTNNHHHHSINPSDLTLESQQHYKANNNDWSNTLPGVIKNGWKEIPQDDENGGGVSRKFHNKDLVMMVNGKKDLHHHCTTALNNTDKLAEQDPLTGGNRRPPELDEISSCGIGSCQPEWAKMFASTHVFMVVFLLAWVLQGMYYTYFVSVITTIEKLFQIKSKTTGLLMSATEVGQIMTALLLTYYAGRGHRPRWIACGMVLFAISAFGCTLPHLIFGNQLLHANNAFYGGSGDVSSLVNSPGRLDSSLNLCKIPDVHSNSSLAAGCKEDILLEQTAHSQITSIVLAIFFISLFGVGIGQTAVSTLGIPYIDDNVASRESPIYIAITIGVRILGPAGGFILGSFCTRLYVDLSDPGFGPSDPKWVGAWYLGLVIISSLMILTSIAMFTFPKHLKGNRIPPPMKMRAIEAQKKLEKQEEEIKPQLKDFPKTIKRQLSNDILMFRTASSVLHLLPVAGLYTFLPKYMESQFRLPAHDANLISGIGGILVMGVGIVISGVVILKCSPTARSVAAWIAFTAVVYSAGMAILMFIGCPMDNFVGLDTISDNTYPKLGAGCNVTCDCDMKKFSPICGSDGLTYFSTCHAGCSSYSIDNGKTRYLDCECITQFDPLTTRTMNAVSGYCDSSCQNFFIFMLLFSFLVFIHSTSEVGSMLLIMRCTDPKDKAMAMGIIQFAIGLFGNVPCPIIYGAVIDSTCLVWETICGKQGACSLYDVDAFRHFFLGTTSGIMIMAFVIDLVVWHKAHRIDIDPESNVSETDLEKPITVTVPESSV